ncbi:ABC transporter substrate-binding protein [Deinococcus pimensis]|uniref:ABC transporter substrate-binding protein n=1 Tax=Deinococcus pimensis TaxID=309888 RepID=UPI0004B84113|nr:ABC transporter substrate-binding protein [Deinococcus pimensis]
MKPRLFLIMTAALASTAGAQKVTLDFWAHWGSEQRRPTINKIIDTWNKAHPDIQVKYTFVPFDQIQTKTLASVAAKNPPDVVVIDIRTSRIRASKNQNTDLSKLGADKVKEQFYANLWTTGTYKGDQYALPFVTESRFLYYNKDAFKEAGLNPGKGPATWDDLMAYAKKLDKKSGPIYQRIGFYPLYGNFGFEGWVQNAGEDTWDDSRDNPNVNSATAVRTLNWIKEWNDRYGSRTLTSFKASFGSGTQDPFISGKLGMIAEAGTYAATLAKYAPGMNYGMVRMPTPTGQTGAMTSWGGGFNVELPAGGQHPKEAYAFAKWFVTEGARIWAKEQNDFPAYKSASLGITSPAFRMMSANMKNTFVSVSPQYAPTYGTYIDKAVDEVLNRDVDAKKALDDAQTQIKRVIEENRR